jgi:hypothetical protein
MLLFRSEEHVDSWCRTWNQSKGGLMTTVQTWELASDDRRSYDWQRKTRDEAQAILDGIGLHSPFWQL